MSDHVQKTIADLQKHLQTIESEATDIKRAINSLRKTIHQPPLYPDADQTPIAAAGPIRADQYYGKALATVAREILEARQAADLGPATVNELYDRMVEGGFVFESKNISNAKRVLRISLSKNTSTFHKLPGGEYGLLDWYPAIRDKKKNGSSASSAESDETDVDDDDTHEAGEEAVGAGVGDDDASTPNKPR